MRTFWDPSGREAGSTSSLSTHEGFGTALEPLVKEKFPFLHQNCNKVGEEVAVGVKDQIGECNLNIYFKNTSQN